ncbi:Histone-lysine N-methyltransferase [Actinidia chinensis var. chinensis]|uniref:Histone-lysine N-methyltransferase n=1 Tax=Actinidia chinensis var. chinensis TaxID=1590841 RepID=A0A2R6Q1G1_ACTCC|nr:Histone-lysine N-methyltransferase [Actinidia chinensis var. chinensis]
MSAWRWSSSAFRWLDLNFSPPVSISRWPRLLSSYLTPIWPHSLGISVFSPSWAPQNLLHSSIVDDVVWSLITAVESVALVSMLCFFFVFCGCTI